MELPSETGRRVAVATAEKTTAASEAQRLLRRAPMAYLWNQLGSIWLYVASFLLTLVAARTLGQERYGVFAVALTLYNTAVYVGALGLDDAATVYVPRAVAERGPAAAARLMRSLLVARSLGLLVVCTVLYWASPPLVSWLQGTDVPGVRFLAESLRVPDHAALALPLVAYIAGTGLLNLLTTIFTSLMRTRLTLVVGGLAQVANVLLVLAAGALGLGVAGVIAALALVAWAASGVYFLLLRPLLRGGREQPPQPLAPVLRLGGVAWLTNLVGGALLKQTAISLLQYAAVTVVSIGYFNLAYQSTHAAALLLIAGLGGVGLAVMSAAQSGTGRQGLGVAWRAVSKVQVLFAVPLLAFTFANANAIAVLLYGADFASVGRLMQVFLIFNIVQRLAGGGSHQAALYVLGRQGWALITQWAGLALTLALGFALVRSTGPLSGPTGALIAVGAGQVGVELAQLALVWRFVRRAYPVGFALRASAAVLPAVLVSLLLPVDSLIPGGVAVAGFDVSGALNLGVALLIFAAMLAGGLILAKPVEQEDVDLLATVNGRFRRLLAPFVAKNGK